MAYLRRQGLSRSPTFNEEVLRQPDEDDVTTSSASDHRLDSFHSAFKNRSNVFHHFFSDYIYKFHLFVDEYIVIYIHLFDSCMKLTDNFMIEQSCNILMKNTNERGGFWGVLARKANSILEDEVSQNSSTKGSKKPETVSFSTSSQFTGIQVQHQYESFESSKKIDNPTLRMALDRNRRMLSLNQIGDWIGNALQAEEKTEDIIRETCDLQNRRRSFDNQENNQDHRVQSAQQQRNQETQLQASRDVALATTAKVKQLAGELKTTTGELAFVKN